MFLVFFTNFNFLSSDLERHWRVPIRFFSPSGCDIAILPLKKSQSRRRCPPLRRRSHLSAGPHPLPNLGTGRLPTGDSNHRAEKKSKDFRNHRTLQCQIYLSLSRTFQCRNLYRIFGDGFTKILSSQSTLDSRQRILSQRS